MSTHLRESKIVLGLGTLPSRIVLRDVSRADRPEFVTHLETLRPARIEDDRVVWEHVGYCHGHYCRTMDEAASDYAERAGRL
jgi:hypothetical protein